MTLGSQIEKARKSAGFSIEDLAAATNLRASLLHEIELNDFSNCGGRTYARGHLRNIARSLNADEKEFLRIFDEEHGTSKRTMHELLVENNVMRQHVQKRKISWKTLALISVVSLAIAAVAQILISNSPPSKVATVTSPTSTTPTPTQGSTPSQSATPAPSTQSSFSTGTGVEVVLDASRGKSWLYVSDAAGQTLFSGQISQGETRVFTSDIRLDLKVGNAGGVDLTVNGHQVPSIGMDGQVVSVTYGVDS